MVLCCDDATGVVSYQEQHCEQCLHKTSKKGRTTWFHNVLEARLVTPNGFSISLLSEWIENPTDDVEATFVNNVMIQCQKLSHHYAGQIALDEIDFELPTGEPIGLVGSNGAGKTSLLNILCGFLRPTSGVVSVFGHKPGAVALQGKVSALPQDASFDPGFSVGEQLSFYARLQGFTAKAARHESKRVLEKLALEAIFKERPSALSHGMLKRVAIAQALIVSPELILLDEPTAGLDPVNTRNVRAIVADLSATTTFIISSHDLIELGRLCQQVLLLNNGVMSSTQLNVSESDSETRFITLQMEPCPAAEVVMKLERLPGVIQVVNSQKNEFIIAYNSPFAI